MLRPAVALLLASAAMVQGLAVANKRAPIVLPTISEEEMDAWVASLGLADPAPRPLSHFNHTGEIGISTRDNVGPGGDCEVYTELAGNGNPHQNYWNVQVTQNFNSGDGSASVTHENSHNIGWTASAGIAQWITGGFSVQENEGTGNSYTCDSSEENQIICVWWNMANTAYTVNNVWSNPNCGKSKFGIVVKSPNQNNVGGGGYCVRGARYCRHIYSGYWNDNGPAGGPQD